MNISGIICEYNPFHKGHEYHIRETRKILGEDSAIVCAMSGNFVQRGEAAILEKHSRAAAAVSCGADLVVEIPLPYVMSSAEGYAMGAVQLLESMGVCTHLSFGSECGDIDLISETADCLMNPEIHNIIRDELSSGISYAAARNRAVHKLIGEKSDVLMSPNNILAVEYVKALAAVGSKMEPIAVRRMGAGHDMKSDEGFASASMVRAEIMAGNDISELLPEPSLCELNRAVQQGRAPVDFSVCENAILSRLRQMGEEDFAQLPNISEGLHLRLMKYAKTEPTIESILEKTKTKRYAYSRLRRLVMCAYLGIKRGDSEMPPQYIRVLAANERGRKLLRKISKLERTTIITKPASAKNLAGRAKDMFETEAASTDLYVLAYPDKTQRFGGQEWKISPVV